MERCSKKEKEKRHVTRDRVVENEVIIHGARNGVKEKETGYMERAIE